MGDIIRGEFLELAQQLHDQGRIADAYAVLADAEDVYAANAYLITNNDQTGLFDFLVPNIWDYVQPGARDAMFMQVAAMHQQNYLNYIRAGRFTTKDGLVFYELPDTYEIEQSYYNSLVNNGLPPQIAIDLLINTAFSGYVSWSDMLTIEESRRSDLRVTLEGIGGGEAFGILFKSQILGLIESGAVPLDTIIQNLSEFGFNSSLQALIVEALQEAENNCFAAGTPIAMWQPDGKGPQTKPVERVKAGDTVLSYDATGALVPGRVSRVFCSLAPHLLDFWGTQVTPGHHYLCADGRHRGRHRPLIDILVADGAVMDQSGTCIRASTGWAVGSLPDRKIWVVAGQRLGEALQVAATAQLRIGLRVVAPDGQDLSLLDLLVERLGPIGADGRLADGRQVDDVVLHWPWPVPLPQPETYLLDRAGLTLADLQESANAVRLIRAARA